ncbi:hypothetical protein A616_17000 [Brevibacillus brevis X23]|nr:hypothetical protein A616_17000 [Brevibacillus brevis X23]
MLEAAFIQEVKHEYPTNDLLHNYMEQGNVKMVGDILDLGRRNIPSQKDHRELDWYELSKKFEQAEKRELLYETWVKKYSVET